MFAYKYELFGIKINAYYLPQIVNLDSVLLLDSRIMYNHLTSSEFKKNLHFLGSLNLIQLFFIMNKALR